MPAAVASGALRPGFRFSKYVLGDVLGAGGFGAVFVAHDQVFGREVAVKFLLSQHTRDPDFIRRFQTEAAATARLHHVAIVTIFDSGVVEATGTDADGCGYIVMERLAGESLASRLERTPRMAVAQAAHVVRQAAAALAVAHAAGIVHRDLKPDNVFLVHDDEVPGRERVKLLDFGIAKISSESAPGGRTLGTSAQAIFGTPEYMSPEQCKSTARVDHRTDIYALGCMLFQMVCGRVPFASGDPHELIGMHQFVAPPAPRSLAPALPPAFEAVILRAMAKDPDARFQTVDELRSALEPFARGVSDQMSPNAPVVPAPASAPTLLVPSSPPRPRRMRPLIVAAAGIVALAMVAIVLSGRRASDDESPTAAGAAEAVDAPRPAGSVDAAPSFRPRTADELRASGPPFRAEIIALRFQPNGSAFLDEPPQQATDAINRIGQLVLDAPDAYVLIEGHSDASMRGTAQEDLVRQLSQERADEVRRAVLVGFPSLDPRRIASVGMGWSAPLVPDDHARNRRIEVKLYRLTD